MSKLPWGSPNITLERVRWFLDCPPVQTLHEQPSAGTPTEVPQPNTISCP